MDFKVIGNQVFFEGYHIADLTQGTPPSILENAVEALHGYQDFEDTDAIYERGKDDGYSEGYYDAKALAEA